MTDRRAYAAMICAVLTVIVGAWAAWHAPRCSWNSPAGPTIGHVIKLYGC